MPDIFAYALMPIERFAMIYTMPRYVDALCRYDDAAVAIIADAVDAASLTLLQYYVIRQNIDYAYFHIVSL